jgi:hypothetical protein
MKLRTSKVLKILGILLFSLESLAPSIFSMTYGRQELVKFSSVEKTFASQCLLLSLYTEACDTEERTETDGKETISLADQLEDESLRFADMTLSHLFLLSQNEGYPSAPSLFELHCTYLI